MIKIVKEIFTNTRRGYIVKLHNDRTGEEEEMHVMAKNKADAEDIAIRKYDYNWIIDAITLHTDSY